MYIYILKAEGLFEVAIESWPDIYIYIYIYIHIQCIYLCIYVYVYFYICI